MRLVRPRRRPVRRAEGAARAEAFYRAWGGATSEEESRWPPSERNCEKGEGQAKAIPVIFYRLEIVMWLILQDLFLFLFEGVID
jgi:hypothetical protein